MPVRREILPREEGRADIGRMRPRRPVARLLDEKREVSYAVVFGIWAEVFLNCVLHDQ